MEQAYRVSPTTASTPVSTNQPELSVIENVQAQIWEGIEQHVKGMVRTLVEEALAAEAGAQVTAAPYERTDERTGYRNGSYRRDLMTRYGAIEDLRVPRVQLLDGSTPPAYQTFDRWERRTPDLERAIGQMFVLGISTRKLRSLCGELWGAPVSSATVSRVTQALDYDVDAFLNRAIEDDIEYLYLDGITAKLRQLGIEGKVMLVALGVHRDGTKEVLGFRLEDSESAASWEALLSDLKRRGLAGDALRMIITDGGPGVIAALTPIYPRIRRQHCLVHASRNVIAKCRMRNKGAVAKGLNGIWEAKNRQAAAREFTRFKARWWTDEERAVRCLEAKLKDCLAFFDEPQEFWRSVRTTNPIERTFREVRRRTKVMDNVTPNADSIKRIFCEIAEAMNRSWRGTTLQAISTTDEA